MLDGKPSYKRHENDDWLDEIRIVTVLRLIDEYYPHIGKKIEKQSWRGSVRRRFCEAHALRGDCGLEDADANYTLISAPPGWKGNADLGAKAAESPSAQMNVAINSLDDLPAAIQQAKDLHHGD